MTDYPICLNNLHRALCIVVGGGNVAERKVHSLLAAGAAVRVISPELTKTLQAWADQGRIQHVQCAYRLGDLEGAFLAFAATDDHEVNRAISTEAQSRQLLVNVVNDPDLGNFTVPAVVRRGSLTISISTEGQSPALAAHLRQRIEQFIGPEYAHLLEIMSELRDQAMDACPTDRRRDLWYQLIESDILDLLRQGMIQEAHERANALFHMYTATDKKG